MGKRAGRPRLEYDGIGANIVGPNLPYAGHQSERQRGAAIRDWRFQSSAGRYDIFSATSSHWLPKPVLLGKIAEVINRLSH
jgi:hypothetical protein